MNADEDNSNDSADSEAPDPKGLSSSSLVGVRVGEYQVLRKLGRGGMADVYAARHLALGREIAIKILRDEFARDKDYVSRFKREARAAAKLNHPNIVQVYDVGDNEMHFIAQELIDGKNLKEVISQTGSLTEAEAIEVIVSVASALEAASEIGIIHRDIKPENIMQSSKGIIKVADFGLARVASDVDATRANLTQAGLTMGTPRYMSPEQVQGKVVDVRSDLYSLGVSMYHLLAGRPPFEADDPLALAVMHLHETPAPLDRARGKDDLPEWIIAIVSKLMSKVPGDRFQSPSELLAAVQSQAAISHKDAYTVGTAAATIRLQRASNALLGYGNRAAMGWIVCLLMALCGAGAGYAFAHRKPQETVGQLLLPETVEESETVEQQYLLAATRDDVAGWNAVREHFPPDEAAENRTYYIKSLLQLSRLQSELENYREALKTVDRILGESKVPSKFLAVAWARKCSVLRSIGDEKELSKAKRTLKTIYDEMRKKNPAGADILRVLPAAERMILESAEDGANQ